MSDRGGRLAHTKGAAAPLWSWPLAVDRLLEQLAGDDPSLARVREAFAAGHVVAAEALPGRRLMQG